MGHVLLSIVVNNLVIFPAWLLWEICLDQNTSKAYFTSENPHCPLYFSSRPLLPLTCLPLVLQFLSKPPTNFPFVNYDCHPTVKSVSAVSVNLNLFSTSILNSYDTVAPLVQAGLNQHFISTLHSSLSGTWYFSNLFLTLFYCFHLFHPIHTFFHLSFTQEKDNTCVI